VEISYIFFLTFVISFSESLAAKDDLSDNMGVEVVMETTELVDEKESSDLESFANAQTNMQKDAVAQEAMLVEVENAESLKHVEEIQLGQTENMVLATDTETNEDVVMQDVCMEEVHDTDHLPVVEHDAEVNDIQSNTVTEVVGEVENIVGIPESEQLENDSIHGATETEGDGLADTEAVNPEHQVDDISDASLIEETGLTEEELQQRTKGQTMCAVKLVEKLGYRPMTLKILKKMRDTFGSEECEYCGRLFFSRMDYEPHVRTHTGRLYNINFTLMVNVTSYLLCVKKNVS